LKRSTDSIASGGSGSGRRFINNDTPHTRIGCAGWTVPKQHGTSFASEGSHLARYAQRFNAVEINSSFYRPHRRSTYERWAASVPDGFAFAAKLPKHITHELRLVATEPALDIFLGQVTGLGPKLGPLLVQLPPSLTFTAAVARTFFAALRLRFAGSIVCEPRHATWFTAPADAALTGFRVARAAADPPIGTVGLAPGGWQGLHYFRLHGSPRIYYSAYEPAYLRGLAKQFAGQNIEAPCWCIFDNTALGAATANALTLQDLVAKHLSNKPLSNPQAP
jgi:uncharacterized protein YecE (DUF72 family)